MMAATIKWVALSACSANLISKTNQAVVKYGVRFGSLAAVKDRQQSGALGRALKPSRIRYVSFKYVEKDRVKDGRKLSDLTELVWNTISGHLCVSWNLTAEVAAKVAGIFLLIARAYAREAILSTGSSIDDGSDLPQQEKVRPCLASGRDPISMTWSIANTLTSGQFRLVIWPR
jgi:hypothetical protein